MKIAAAATLAFAASASAFTATPVAKSGLALRMADAAMDPMPEPEKPKAPELSLIHI